MRAEGKRLIERERMRKASNVEIRNSKSIDSQTSTLEWRMRGRERQRQIERGERER